MRLLLLCTLTTLLSAATHLPYEQYTEELWYYHYSHNDLEKAKQFLAARIEKYPDELPTLAYYAETMQRLGEAPLADSLAARCSELDPEWGRPYAIRGAMRMKQYGTNDLNDSAAAIAMFERSLSGAKPHSPSWEVRWIDAINTRDTALEARSLRGLYDSPLYPESLREMARWFLTHLPESTVLITNGDRDTYPVVMVQHCEKLRPDVLVVNQSLLNVSQYIEATLLRANYGEAEAKELAAVQHEMVDGALYTKAHKIMEQMIARSRHEARPVSMLGNFSATRYHPTLQRTMGKPERVLGMYHCFGETAAPVTGAELHAIFTDVISRKIERPMTDARRETSPIMLNSALRNNRGFDSFIGSTAFDCMRHYVEEGDSLQALAVFEKLTALERRIEGGSSVLQRFITVYSRAIFRGGIGPCVVKGRIVFDSVAAVPAAEMRLFAVSNGDTLAQIQADSLGGFQLNMPENREVTLQWSGLLSWEQKKALRAKGKKADKRSEDVVLCTFSTRKQDALALDDIVVTIE